MEINTTLVHLVLMIGAPILMILYYLEGLLVGKLLHPSILFILYVVVTGPNLLVLVIVTGSCTLMTTAGQWALYRGFNEEIEQKGFFMRITPYIDRIPSFVRSRIGKQRMDFIDRQFDQFGAAAICVSNATPGLRGLMTIVAGLSAFPQRRFVLLSALGNAIYMILLATVSIILLRITHSVSLSSIIHIHI